jgi:uncharacterized protein YdeI (YjbR/CyaY-like superfamily)
VSHEDARFFVAPADLRAWLDANHGKASELWVGYWKKGSGQRGITYQQSLDEALAFGWIDGLTRKIDEDRYATRFTPRRPTSNWSQANIRRVGKLGAEGRMTAAGMRAFATRSAREPGEYAYETRPPDLPEPYAGRFRRNEAAWRFWLAQRPAYRKSMTWWVVSAKQEDTRLRRLDALIAESAAEHVVDEVHLPKVRGARPEASRSS